MSEMEICKEEEFIKQIFQRYEGWRVIKAREKSSYQYYILSPEGKRFETIEDVHDFLLEEEDLRKRGLRKKPRDIPTYLTTNIILRRQQMKMKNPLSNLLKKTLEKAHLMNDVMSKTGSDKMQSIIAYKELSKRKKKMTKMMEKKAMIAKATEKKRHRGF